jgi:hypothetical protein
MGIIPKERKCKIMTAIKKHSHPNSNQVKNSKNLRSGDRKIKLIEKN